VDAHGGDEDDDLGALRYGRPSNELPVPVPVSVVLARTDDVAVALVGVQAYTSGISFTLSVRLRHSRVLPGRRDLHELVGGWSARTEGRLLLGVEFSDGRAASTAGVGRSPAPGSGLGQALLVPAGGGGGELSVDHDYWLTPVPPPGPLDVVLACAGLGIEETTVQLDGDALVQAAARAEVLWPAAETDEPDELDEPDLPDGGWFGALRDPDEPG
jgi:hypothetical protein